jgi:p-aminobenzoyl-glutamate transporter AbgT
MQMISREYHVVLRLSSAFAIIMMAVMTWLWNDGVVSLWAVFAPVTIFLVIFLTCFARDWKKSINSPLGALMQKRW